jgi:hypothetical protein
MTTPKPPYSEDQEFTRALLRLDTKLLGVVMGLVVALVVFVATLWLVIMGGHVDSQGEIVVGPHLALLGYFFIGYRITFLGSFIGALYGFALGSIVGAVIGHIYNRLSLLRKPPGHEISSKW